MKHRASNGFSLTELLVVLAILGILAALVIPTFGPMVRASNLTKASSLILDELGLARQLALSQNRDVEVRFYLVPAKEKDGNIAFRALQSLYVNGAKPSTPIGKLVQLPDGISILDSAKFSTLLDTNLPERQGTEQLPGFASPLEYRSFLFRANGGTNLAPITGTFFVTVTAENAPKNALTDLPDNYFAAQIDPVTGRTRLFRP